MYSNELVCEILDIINNNINCDISIDDLSLQLFFDKTYIMKKFKKELDITIFNYINSIRILNSLDLFKYDNNILYIALKNGFNSIEYYSEMFKKYIGVSPRVYKRFIYRNKNIIEEQFNTINANVNKLYILKHKVNDYLSRRKPKVMPTKKLIFRQ